jgi:mannobiose 2-epimerase
MDAAQRNDFRRQVHDQLFGHILPFWCGPALDHEQGGWMAWLSNDLTPDRSQPKGLIVNARILWAFSAVHRAHPDPLYRQMAERAFDVVFNRFWDTQHGGAYWRLDGDGRVLDDSKKTYGQAFYLYALAEYGQAFNSAAALARAKDLFDLIERHAHDAQHDGYFEVRRRDWSEAATSQLSEKDMVAAKSMNNHLHVLEAYTNLYRVWPDTLVQHRLRELITIFEQRILDPCTHHLHHFFDERWESCSDSYTFGHDIEASWLLCEAAEVLGDQAVLEAVHGLALRMAEGVLAAGLDPDGGLCYEGQAGKVIDSGKECWPQAEAVAGFLNAFQLSGDARYLDAAHSVWRYLEEHLVDRVHGEWFWRINPDGRPDPRLPKVSEWKGPYHGTRACLETLRRLASL